jgi:hypothetical protein
MNKIILVLCVLYFHALHSDCQIVNKWGIKGGLILSKISLSDYNPDFFSSEPSGKYKFLSFDAGIFVEFFDSRYFCISTELHYNIKGEEDEKLFKTMVPVKSGLIEMYEYKYMNDRFHYLSLQFLPRWKYIVNSEDKLYFFAGPKFDLRLSNSSSISESAVKFTNSRLEAGLTLGIGNEIWDLFSFELRFEHNFSNAYSIVYGDESYNRKHNSFYLLAGLSLKKLLRINL